MAGKLSPRLSAAVVGCALVALNVNTAWASGFFIREQSSTAQGNSFAGATAGADDISYLFFNPAGLTRHTESEVYLSSAYIIPRSKADDLEGEVTSGPAAGAPIQGESNTGDIGEDAFVPALYGMWALHEDFRLGLGITFPFGLVTDNPEDSVARYHGTRSELKSVNINPVVAYKVTDWMSIGGGLQVQYVETQLQNAINAGGSGIRAEDVDANLRGDSFGYGFTAGLLFEPLKGTRIGLSYRSGIDHDIRGNVDFDPSVGPFVTSDAEADFDTPDIARIGIYQDITEEWAVMADLSWTDWSDFDTLRIKFDDPNLDDSITEEDWEDTLFVAAGVTYKPQAVEGLTLRLGFAFDDSPIPENRRTPRIPGGDRYWVSVGAGYKPFDWAEITLAYTHVFVEDGDINLDGDGNDLNRGSLTGSYDNAIDIITLGGRIIF